jgi:hypothetical protein
MQVLKKMDLIENVALCSLWGERKPMHPDDFAAHHAWVTARRVREIEPENTFVERRFVTG